MFHRTCSTRYLLKTTVLLSLLVVSVPTSTFVTEVTASSNPGHANLLQSRDQQQDDDGRRILQQYPQYINPPTITYAGFVTSLAYTVRDNVREGLMDIELYQDAGCSHKINRQTNNYLDHKLIPDLTIRGDGEGTRLVRLVFVLTVVLTCCGLFGRQSCLYCFAKV